MSLNVTCPCCAEHFPIEAGWVDGDAKRLGHVLAGMDPVLGRAAVSYLRLFKPGKQALRLVKAVKLLQELETLVSLGTVCADDRGGVHRPATSAQWASGIEQMTGARAGLSLPLANHNYLRKVVYAIADQADAALERQREAHRRSGRRDDAAVACGSARGVALSDALNQIANDAHLGIIDEDERDKRMAAVRVKYGIQS